MSSLENKVFKVKIKMQVLNRLMGKGSKSILPHGIPPEESYNLGLFINRSVNYGSTFNFRLIYPKFQQ